jgi:GYF domain 2
MWHRSILGCPSGPASMQAQSACGACETPPGPLLQVRSGEEADFAAMGIRFACPNGHKLHVKAFLAGKRGICPHCGVHFRVPSAEGPESESSSEVLAVTDVQPPPMQSPVARAAVAAIPHPQTPPVTSTADLFPQDPASVWYVRPTQGGQYGPASATVMRNWVLEGRVPPDAFVWSQGWTEWQRASEAFAAAQARPGRRDSLGDWPLPRRPHGGRLIQKWQGKNGDCRELPSAAGSPPIHQPGDLAGNHQSPAAGRPGLCRGFSPLIPRCTPGRQAVRARGGRFGSGRQNPWPLGWRGAFSPFKPFGATVYCLRAEVGLLQAFNQRFA